MNPQQIRRLRTRLNLTQTQLAEAVGVSQSAVAHWEEGRRTPSGPAAILLRQITPRKKTDNSGELVLHSR